MENTVLHLPGGDFEILREEDLEDPQKRRPLLAKMLEGDNFGRAFAHLRKIAEELGIVDFKDTPQMREELRTRLSL